MFTDHHDAEMGKQLGDNQDLLYLQKNHELSCVRFRTCTYNFLVVVVTFETTLYHRF